MKIPTVEEMENAMQKSYEEAREYEESQRHSFDDSKCHLIGGIDWIQCISDEDHVCPVRI